MSFIERLKQKPEREKKAIALAFSVSVTLIVGVVWLLARTAMQGL